MKTKQNKFIWIMGYLGLFASAGKLTQAAQASDATASDTSDSKQSSVSPMPSFGDLQNTVNSLNQQMTIDQALQELRERYGDDIVKRLILQFDGQHLQVIGIQKDSPEHTIARQPTTE